MIEIDRDIPLPVERPTLSGREPLPEVHTVKEAMEALKVGHSTLYVLLSQQELTAIKIGSKTLVLGLRELIERKAAEARRSRELRGLSRDFR